jgi:hypothetical protein
MADPVERINRSWKPCPGRIAFSSVEGYRVMIFRRIALAPLRGLLQRCRGSRIPGGPPAGVLGLNWGRLSLIPRG